MEKSKPIIKTDKAVQSKSQSTQKRPKTDEAEERATGKGSMQNAVKAELK
jgi:hypothetical protein